MAAELHIPLVHGATFPVPNVTPTQKTTILRVMRYTVCSTKHRAWEKQAIKKVMRVVRTSPHTVQSIFSKQATKMDWASQPPPCTCSRDIAIAQQYGTVTDTEGHIALVRVSVYDVQGRTLRPKDSLPMRGTYMPKEAVKAIEAFATEVGGKYPYLDTELPPSLFPCTGDTLKRVQQASKKLSVDFYVRIVDKGAGVLWGFCKHGVWLQVAEFLTKGGYQRVPRTASDFVMQVGKLAAELGWARSERAKLCLYITGKAQSLGWKGLVLASNRYVPLPDC